jgi:hypothetical protein
LILGFFFNNITKIEANGSNFLGEENGPKPMFMWGIEKCVKYINSPSFESKPKFNVEKHENNV